VTGPDSISAPLAYPGEPPSSPAALVLPAALTEFVPSAAPLGEWAPVGQSGDGTLDRALAAAGAAPMAVRTPVLAVGSNASPAQLRRKFSRAGVPVVVPITAVAVHGIAVGVSAHVSRPGYVPATPVPNPAETSRLFITWLDARGLDVMDETEPNYDRLRLEDTCAVELPPDSQLLQGCLLYVSRHGYLTDQLGRPRKLPDQRTLITALLAEVPGLAVIAGTTPDEWVRRSASAHVRNQIRESFLAAGIVRTDGVPARPPRLPSPS
jgi:hypothetical protein